MKLNETITDFYKVMKNGLSGQEFPHDIIRVSRRQVSISKKQAIEWNIKFEPLKADEGDDVGAPNWFKEFKDEFDVFRNEFNDLRSEFNGFQSEFNGFRKDFNQLKKEFAEIKELPTIKKELEEARKK